MIARLCAWLGSAEFADAVLLTLGIRLVLLVFPRPFDPHSRRRQIATPSAS